MNIKVTEIKYIKDDKFIYFISNLGYGKAYWPGNEPILNQEYDVELNIEDDLIWNKNVFLGDSEGEFIRIEEEFVLLNGKIERLDVEDEFILYLDKSVIFVDISDMPFYFSGFVTIKSRELKVFDCNL